jgi:WD40 repeat protein
MDEALWQPPESSSTLIYHSSRRKFIVGLLGSGLLAALCIPPIKKFVTYQQEMALVRKLPEHLAIGRELLFSQDLSSVIALNTQTNNLLIWHYAAQRIIQQFDIDPESRGHTWSPNQRYLLYNSNNAKYSLDLLELSTHKKVFTSTGDYAAVSFDRAYWSPDSKYIAVGSSEGLMLIEAATGRVLVPLYQLKSQGIAYVSPYVWSPDSKRLALMGFRTSKYSNSFSTLEVLIWDRDTQSIVSQAFNPMQVSKLGEGGLYRFSWSPDGRRIAAFLGQQLWLLKPNNATKSVLISDQYSINDWSRLAWSPDSRLLAVFSDLKSPFKEELAIWRVADLQKVQVIDPDSFSGEIAQMYWPPNGQCLMAIIAPLGTQISLLLSN